MSRRPRSIVAVVVLAVSLLVGCGDDGDSMSRRTADRLHDQVAAIQYAAAGGAYDAARQGLDRLRATVDRLEDRGELNPLQAGHIRDEADRVDEVLADLTAG